MQVLIYYLANACYKWLYFPYYNIGHDEQQNNQSYFGRRVSVLFDDGNWYKGVITGKDPKTQLWVTIFEDGTEDFTKDPLNDKDYELMD